MNTSEIMSAMIFGDGGASKVEELSTDGGSTDAGKVLVVGDNGKIAASDLTVGEGEVAIDKGLVVNGAAADAKAVGDAITSLNGSLGDLSIISETSVLNANPTKDHSIAAATGSRIVWAKCIANATYVVNKIATKRFSVFFTSSKPAVGVSYLDHYKVDATAEKITIDAPSEAKYICAYVYNADTDSGIATEDEVLNSTTITQITAYDAIARSNSQKNTDAIHDGFDYFERLNNLNYDLIPYDYEIETTELVENPSSTTGGAIGIKRCGTLFRLNGTATGSSATRIRMNGSILRATSDATVTTWTDGLILEAGTSYTVRLENLTAINTDVRVSVYEEGAASTLGKGTRNGGVFERTFVATSTPVSLALFIPAGTVLNNNEYRLTLFKATASLYPAIATYFADEMTDTIEKVRSANDEPSLVFPIVTDIHRFSSDATKETFEEMIANITTFANHVKCDFMLNLGDVTDGDESQAVTLARGYDCTEKFNGIGIPYFFSLGNHDTNPYGNGQNLFDINEIYKAWYQGNGKMTTRNFDTNGTDYYVDFDDCKVRLIVLNANNVQNGGTKYAYASETIAWMPNALNTEYRVIIAVHQSPIRTQNDGGVATANAGGIITALEAFVGSGKTLIMLSGHTHRDIAFIKPWVNIVNVCQRFTEHEARTNAGDITGYIDEVVNPARTSNTYTEDAWTIGVYKTIHNDLHMIRFGAGNDRIFHLTPITEATTVYSELSGTLVWSTSDSSIATVADGTISQISNGSCAILSKNEIGDYECWIVNFA